MPEQENTAISRITNHELVIQRFGYWPSFHDAEVLKVTFEANPGYRATVTFLLETHEFINELDSRGYYKQVNNCRIELNFTGIHEMHFEDFSHQNVIFGLKFKEAGEFIECAFDTSVGLVASIVAEESIILSLVSVEPEIEQPLIDIEAVDMSLAANIMLASQDLTHDFKWSEWIYIGLNNEKSNDYRSETVSTQVRDFFHNEPVYLISEENSLLINLEDFLSQISVLVNSDDVLICDKNFIKAMRFNMIGVMSYGYKRT